MVSAFPLALITSQSEQAAPKQTGNNPMAMMVLAHFGIAGVFRSGPRRASEKTEVRGQRSEGRGQRSEVGGQRSEVRGRRSEVGGQRSEIRGRRSEVPSLTPQYFVLYDICNHY